MADGAAIVGGVVTADKGAVDGEEADGTITVDEGALSAGEGTTTVVEGTAGGASSAFTGDENP